MAIDINLEVGDGQCPAGTRHDAQIQILKTSGRTNAGGFRINLKQDSRGRFAMLRTPEPWVGYCDYEMKVYPGANDFKFQTVTWTYKDLSKDKNLIYRLKPPVAPLMTTCPTCGQLWVQLDPPPPPPPTPGEWEWPTTDMGMEPPPTPKVIPPREGSLIGWYRVDGSPRANEPYTITGATVETGVTNSLGEIHTQQSGSVVLEIDGAVIDSLIGPEKVTMEVSNI